MIIANQSNEEMSLKQITVLSDMFLLSVFRIAPIERSALYITVSKITRTSNTVKCQKSCQLNAINVGSNMYFHESIFILQSVGFLSQLVRSGAEYRERGKKRKKRKITMNQIETKNVAKEQTNTSVNYAKSNKVDIQRSKLWVENEMLAKFG